jgi:hypothetical protein
VELLVFIYGLLNMLILILEKCQVTLSELVEPVVLIDEDVFQSVLLSNTFLELGDKHTLLCVLKTKVVESCLVLAL